MDSIHHYFRDNKEISHEEWSVLLEHDLEEENKLYEWDISGPVYTDIGECRDINLNDHDYKIRYEDVYESAKELLDDLIVDGYGIDILDAIRTLSEMEASMIVKHIERVKVNNEKYVLRDAKDY